jgi:hypothetical protein
VLKAQLDAIALDPIWQFQKSAQPMQFAVSVQFNIHPAFCSTDDCADCDHNDVYQFMIFCSILPGTAR